MKIGFKFNNFKTISKPYTKPSNRKNRGKSDLVVDCQCKCGNIRVIKLFEVLAKTRKSCGCTRSYKAVGNQKHCVTCYKTKDLIEFNTQKTGDGYRSTCKQCLKGRWLKSKYNISLEDYNSLLLKQNYKCACCDGDKPNTVDHCHKTGKIRGILCFKCNTSIGKLGDTADDLFKAFQYLKSTE